MTDPNRPINEPDFSDNFEPEGVSAFDSEIISEADDLGPDTPASMTATRLPDPNRRLGRTGPLWGALAIFLAVILAIFLFTRGGDDTATVPAIQVTTGVAGGAILPTDVVETTATPLPPTATPIPVLQVGQRVQVANTDGEGIRFRADASTESLTQDIYNDGALFTVLEPDGDYDSYPVEVEGLRWYRLQADDGLVGWTIYDYLAPAEGE